MISLLLTLSGHSKENSSNSSNDHVYSNQRRKKRRKRHHRFCIKCVTSSFASLFRVLKEPIDITYTNTIKKTEVKNLQVAKGIIILDIYHVSKKLIFKLIFLKQIHFKISLIKVCFYSWFFETCFFICCFWEQQ